MHTQLFKGMSSLKIRSLSVDVGQMPTGWAILVIVLLSCMVKFAYIVAFGGGLANFPTEGSDAVFYDSAARVILKSGVYGLSQEQPITVMPPGQSFFLAALYLISNGSIAFAKLAHMLLLTSAAILVYFTGKTIARASVGFGAAVLTAIDPAQAYLSGTFLSEPLFIFLTTLAIYLILLSIRNQKSSSGYLYLISAGICFAAAGLTRNQGWLFPIFIFVCALFTRGRIISVKSSLVILLVTTALIAPWTYRNYRVSGHFIIVSSEGGLTLWACNNPEFRYRSPAPMSQPLYQAPPGLTELELDRYYRKKATQWIFHHPGRFIVNGVKKILVLYHFDPMSWRTEKATLFRLGGLFPYGVVLPFIFWGILTRFRQRQLGIIVCYLLFNTLLAILFCGDSRLRAPMQPYLYLFSIFGFFDFYSLTKFLIKKTQRR